MCSRSSVRATCRLVVLSFWRIRSKTPLFSSDDKFEPVVQPDYRRARRFFWMPLTTISHPKNRFAANKLYARAFIRVHLNSIRGKNPISSSPAHVG
jgi:hypothetical protein